VRVLSEDARQRGSCPGVDLRRISPSRAERKLSEPEPAIARLSPLVHAPSLDDVDPAPNDLLVLLGDKIKEAPADSQRGRDKVVVGDVDDGGVDGEAVEDEGGPDRLLWERIEHDCL
jgi:hypothetical protein